MKKVYKKEIIAVLKHARNRLELTIDSPWVRDVYGDLGLLLMKLDPKEEHKPVSYLSKTQEKGDKQ